MWYGQGERVSKKWTWGPTYWEVNDSQSGIVGSPGSLVNTSPLLWPPRHHSECLSHSWWFYWDKRNHQKGTPSFPHTKSLPNLYVLPHTPSCPWLTGSNCFLVKVTFYLGIVPTYSILCCLRYPLFLYIITVSLSIASFELVYTFCYPPSEKHSFLTPCSPSTTTSFLCSMQQKFLKEMFIQVFPYSILTHLFKFYFSIDNILTYK